ncbi:MAG: hypothetical protein PF501_19820 [Salinisphaera sp.]|jgi:hypothetical protein|nr:hypothetical protein [Salinisphaera sp.]
MLAIDDLLVGDEIDEGKLTKVLTRNDVFAAFIDENHDYETHSSGGLQTRTLATQAYASIASRILASEAFKQVFGGSDTLRQLICERFQFCEKIKTNGKTNTAKELRGFILGVASAKIGAAAGFLLFDPTFLTVAALLLVFYALKKLCGCDRVPYGSFDL